MRKILILMGRYLPGHKDGGPLRTIINLTDTLGEEYDFRIACLDRDHGDTEQYQNIQIGEWNRVGKAKVWYVKPKGFTYRLLKQLSEEVDLIYCCGFYNDYGYKSLILNKLGKMQHKPVVIASMGAFSKGALAHKKIKKRLFIFLLRFFGLFRKITWSVTSELEAEDLKRVIGKNVCYVVAEDLPRAVVPGRKQSMCEDNPVKIAFLSRICPQKNLIGAVRSLQGTHSQICFYIYGPKEDEQYWMLCEKELKKTPANVRWEYLGDVPTENVQGVLQENDIFLFPTLGENYGHVIFEALSVGCVPIISDQTPWNEIADIGAGYVLPVHDIRAFADAIDAVCQMDLEDRGKMSEKAVRYAVQKMEQSRKGTGYREIFELL